MTLLDITPAGFVQEVTKFGGDFTRSYLFSIDIPAAGIDNGTGNRNSLTVFARSTELPAYTLVTKLIELEPEGEG